MHPSSHGTPASPWTHTHAHKRLRVDGVEGVPRSGAPGAGAMPADDPTSIPWVPEVVSAGTYVAIPVCACTVDQELFRDRWVRRSWAGTDANHGTLITPMRVQRISYYGVGRVEERVLMVRFVFESLCTKISVAFWVLFSLSWWFCLCVLNRFVLTIGHFLISVLIDLTMLII